MRGMLITANQPFKDWVNVFPDPAMTVAAIDRLVSEFTADILARQRPPPRRWPRSTPSYTDWREANRQELLHQQREPHRAACRALPPALPQSSADSSIMWTPMDQ